MRRVITGTRNYPLASPRWFPPKVSEEIFREPAGECVPLDFGEWETGIPEGVLFLEKLEAERL